MCDDLLFLEVIGTSAVSSRAGSSASEVVKECEASRKGWSIAHTLISDMMQGKLYRGWKAGLGPKRDRVFSGSTSPTCRNDARLKLYVTVYAPFEKLHWASCLLKSGHVWLTS